MNVLTVQNLCKSYPSFALDHVSFSLAPGKITGLIGRNGAGKSTTLKSLLRFVHPDSGEVRFFGLDFDAHQKEIKQRLGFVAGGVDYYPRKSSGPSPASPGAFIPIGTSSLTKIIWSVSSWTPPKPPRSSPAACGSSTP